MPYFEATNAYSGYPDLLRDVLEFGIDRASPGGDIREVENFSIVFEGSAYKTHTPPRAGSVPLLGLLAGAQLLSGASAHVLTEQLFPVVAQHPAFERPFDGRTYRYGQLEKAFEVLAVMRDLGSPRDVVVSWWDPCSDAVAGAGRPTTLTTVFRVRDGVLSMTVNSRFTDLWRCAPVEFVQFGLLQDTLATALGLASGPYVHQTNSLHIHLEHLHKAEYACSLMHHPAHRGRFGPVPIRPLAERGWDFAQIAQEAEASFTGGAPVTTDGGHDIKARISARLTSVAHTPL